MNGPKNSLMPSSISSCVFLLGFGAHTVKELTTRGTAMK